MSGKALIDVIKNLKKKKKRKKRTVFDFEMPGYVDYIGVYIVSFNHVKLKYLI